jgi:hypothetical protein
LDGINTTKGNMRSTALTLLVLSSLALAAPLRTDDLDHEVAKVDTPKNIHQQCDMRNPQCSTLSIFYKLG